jgi:hypothetical protein
LYWDARFLMSEMLSNGRELEEEKTIGLCSQRIYDRKIKSSDSRRIFTKTIVANDSWYSSHPEYEAKI